jgi:hypothetical protein
VKRQDFNPGEIYKLVKNPKICNLLNMGYNWSGAALLPEDKKTNFKDCRSLTQHQDWKSFKSQQKNLLPEITKTNLELTLQGHHKFEYVGHWNSGFGVICKVLINGIDTEYYLYLASCAFIEPLDAKPKVDRFAKLEAKVELLATQVQELMESATLNTNL